MDNTVLTALIGLGGSALGSLFGVLASSKLTQYRLAQLEKKVEAHNQTIAGGKNPGGQPSYQRPGRFSQGRQIR